MTPEKKAKLDEIIYRFSGVVNHTRVTSPQLYDVQWLMHELKSAWAREAELVKALEQVIKEIQCDCDAQTDPQWCPHIYEGEVAYSALVQHKASLEK